ncbi:MAG: secretin N-terminal domain-containing protein [Elusimicrobia bacterium]|nr:secretin N-terminal domain-containing protein [Elusimicrobiota bacterium]
MITHHRRPAVLRSAASCATALAMLAASVPPAAAQRRRGEPEANPQFSQQLSAPGAEAGGPLLEAPASEPSPRGVQGVQIGTVSGASRGSAAAPVAPLETRVTVRVKGAPLATFLDTISAQAKVNFIITEGLESKKVTAFLQNVTVRDALQVLLEIKGLTYQRIGQSNTYVVAPRSQSALNLITRIYTLAYTPLMALAEMKDDQASINPGAGLALPGGSSDAGGAKGGKDDADSGVSIVNVLRSVLSKNGHVALEPRTNSLVVTDIPEVFPQVEQIISELDRKPPQVMIEAQIVEIDSTRSRDIGLEWGGANGELASFVGGARDTSFPLTMARDFSAVKFFDPVTNVVSGMGQQGGQSDSSAQSESGGANLVKPLLGSNVLTSVLDLTSLKVTLRALVSRAEARFLGKPKILTLNNKPAIIQVASNQAVGVASQQSSFGSNMGTSVTAAERYWTGLVLKVVPQINKEGYITMLVQPSFTDVKEASISTQGNPIFDPISRGASTLVRVRNGQTLVMGGLLRSTESKVVRKVPILGYIPIIGWFFTSTSTRRDNSDLVIFLTPTIVSD